MKVVVFVDVQKDFIDGALRNEKAIEVTPKIVEFAKECVKNGYKIYATRDTHEKTKYYGMEDTIWQKCADEWHKSNVKNGSELKIPTVKSGYLATLEGKKLPIEHCIEGTDGWMIDERLWNAIEGKATVVNKNTFGSIDLVSVIEEDFFETSQYVESVHCMLNCCPRESGPLDEIVICGFCTSICVLANSVLLRSKFPNTKITVMKDLCADISEYKHKTTLDILKSQQIDIV